MTNLWLRLFFGRRHALHEMLLWGVVLPHNRVRRNCDLRGRSMELGGRQRWSLSYRRIFGPKRPWFGCSSDCFLLLWSKARPNEDDLGAELPKLDDEAVPDAASFDRSPADKKCRLFSASETKCHIVHVEPLLFFWELF